MPVLTDADISRELSKPASSGPDYDPLIIHPILDSSQITGTKVELRMDNELYRFKQGISSEGYSTDKRIVLNDYADRIIIPYGDPVMLHPGELMVTYSFEFIRMPRNMMGRMEPRARLTKMGLSTSVGTVDPGFEDHLLILFVNNGRFSLTFRPLMRVVGMSIELLGRPVEKSMKEKPNPRPRLDPDNLVLNTPDYDSTLLENYHEIVSRRYDVPRENTLIPREGGEEY